LWAEEEEFPFELWTDTDKTLALYYGAISSANATSVSRVTRILDEEGHLLLKYDDASFVTNPTDVLEDCQQLFAPQ
jgi:peroxiredoxin